MMQRRELRVLCTRCGARHLLQWRTGRAGCTRSTRSRRLELTRLARLLRRRKTVRQRRRDAAHHQRRASKERLLLLLLLLAGQLTRQGHAVGRVGCLARGDLWLRLEGRERTREGLGDGTRLSGLLRLELLGSISCRSRLCYTRNGRRHLARSGIHGHPLGSCLSRSCSGRRRTTGDRWPGHGVAVQRVDRQCGRLVRLLWTGRGGAVHTMDALGRGGGALLNRCRGLSRDCRRRRLL